MIKKFIDSEFDPLITRISNELKTLAEQCAAITNADGDAEGYERGRKEGFKAGVTLRDDANAVVTYAEMFYNGTISVAQFRDAVENWIELKKSAGVGNYLLGE